MKITPTLPNMAGPTSPAKRRSHNVLLTTLLVPAYWTHLRLFKNQTRLKQFFKSFIMFCCSKILKKSPADSRPLKQYPQVENACTLISKHVGKVIAFIL